PGLGSGVVSWLGRSITNAGFLHGFGFGAVTAITIGVSNYLLADKITNDWLRLGASSVIGGAVAYGVSAGAAALGIVAAPVTVTGALILTISSVAFIILAAIVEEIVKRFNNSRQEPSSTYDSTLEAAEILVNRRAERARAQASVSTK